MPANEFEKKVQQKMDELQLRPSAEVWGEVEKRIRKEKKRRLILWVFPLLLLLVAGGVWIATGNKKTISDKGPVTQAATDTSQQRNEEVRTEMLPPQSTEYEKNRQLNIPPVTFAQANNQTAGKKNIPGKATVNISVKTIEKPRHSFADTAKNKKQQDDEEDKQVIKINNSQPFLIQQGNERTDTIKYTYIAQTDPNKLLNDSADITKLFGTDEPEKNPPLVNPALKDSLVILQPGSIAKNNFIKTKKNLWKFDVTVMAGISGRSDRLLFFNEEKQLDASLMTVGGGPTRSVSPPEKPKKGFYWQTGVNAKRSLSPRTGIAAGINFSSYSATQFTGVYVDSNKVFSNSFYSLSVPGFYRAGSDMKYRNHYYYLEFPFSFHWQINKGKRLPLTWQNGISTGIFLGSDALVYNADASVFYRDNRSFNKIQFAAQSVLYTTLFNRSKNPLTAGLLFDYHINRLQQFNNNGGNHLTSFGIRLGYTLKKNSTRVQR